MTERVAIVQEWISARAGSEQVFEQLARLFPQADLYALSRDPTVSMDFDGRPLTTTFLDHSVIRTKRGLTLPLMPLAWRVLGKGDYDLVISSHHAFASSNRLTQHGRRLAYVHSPARYIWSPEIDERGAHPLFMPIRRMLQSYDKSAARGLTSIAANSEEVAMRIRRFWGREALVIHPPVDTGYFHPKPTDTTSSGLPDEYILSLGRWIPYKNHDLVIRVAEELRIPAVIAGSGPQAPLLRAMAKSSNVPVTLFEAPDRSTVRRLLQHAKALVFPTHEDFGMIPVEAMASGTPVVALAQGGALETIKDGVSGYLVADHSPRAYAQAVRLVDSIRSTACLERAELFSTDAFDSHVREWISGDA